MGVKKVSLAAPGQPTKSGESVRRADTLTPQADRARLLDLLHGYRATCLIVTALEVGLFDELRAAPLDERLLARRLGAHEPSLRRLLRGLELIGLVECLAGGTVLTATGRLLVDSGAGVRERAVLAGREYLPAWQELRYAVMTGKTAFERAFGLGAWDHRQRHPELSECVNRTMTDDQRRTAGAVPAAYDFSACRLVVDVGGGQGSLLADILVRYPQPEGLLFDQAHVVAGAPTILSAAGVQDRCRIVAGSFFESVPGGGDLYLLQHILHDWDDERCLAILRRCRSAMAAGGTLLVIENIVPEDGAPGAHLVMLDLQMMIMLGGRERTRSEYRFLLEAAGLALRRSVSTRAGTEILVALPST